MEKRDLSRILLGCGMTAALLFAGCGGGSGGGGATAIDTPADAKVAAGSTALVFTGGLSSLVSSKPAPAPRLSRVQKFVANFKATKMPQSGVASQALAAMPAPRPAAAILKAAALAPVETVCSSGGSMTVDSTLDSVTGSSSEEIVYANCNSGFGVMNGRVKHSQTINAAATSITFTELFGDGDETLEATDLVFTAPDGTIFTSTGTNVEVIALTSGKVSDYQGKGNAGYDETCTMETKDSIRNAAGIDLTLTVDLDSSETVTQSGDGSSFAVTGDEQLSGTMTLAGTSGGQNVQFAFSANNASEHFTESFDAVSGSTTSTSEPRGRLSFDLLPTVCFDGTFEVETVTPLRTVDSGTTSTTVEGEILINDNTRFSYSNNRITVTMNGSPVFSGSEAELFADLDDACPLFFVLQ